MFDNAPFDFHDAALKSLVGNLIPKFGLRY